MIEQTATTYDAPAAYLPHLIAWAEDGAAHYSTVAAVQRRHAFIQNAESYDAMAAKYRRIAEWAVDQLADISGLSLDDADEHAAIQAKTASLVARGVLLPDRPPSTLVGLTDWLRGQVGRWFPSLPAEMWQGVAYLLHHRRAQ